MLNHRSASRLVAPSHGKRRHLPLLAILALSLLSSLAAKSVKTPKLPLNFVVIFVDDLGYGDLGTYGAPTIKTPHLDRMANEGLKTTHFYVASSVCSASRASLLTGRYPDRHGTGGVYFPGSQGLSHEELTIAELLQESGYATAAIGKWHLGDLENSLPTSHGFDTYFGIPYSNDMWIGPHHEIADDCTFTQSYTREKALNDQAFIRKCKANRQMLMERGIKEFAPLMRETQVVEYPAEQSTLTQRYFDEAIKFLDTTRERPSFLFLTPAMPHVPLFASEDFAGKSQAGIYGDTIEEIDWNVGRLLEFLDREGLSESTLVLFTSDNGPWLGKGTHAGSSGPFRDGKFSAYEGGVRVPAILRMSGTIPAGSLSMETIVTTDLFPTLAAMADLKFDPERFDGIDITAHLENPDTAIKRPAHFYNMKGQVVGVRQGAWKYLPKGGGRFFTEDDGPELYNLNADPAERFNLFEQHPEQVAQLQALINQRLQSTP